MPEMMFQTARAASFLWRSIRERFYMVCCDDLAAQGTKGFPPGGNWMALQALRRDRAADDAVGVLQQAVAPGAVEVSNVPRALAQRR